VSQTAIIRWAVICGTAALVGAAVLPADDPVDDPQAPVFELLDANEIPNSIIDDLLGIGADVVTFLMRAVPFVP
jgi:hypothetical protein